MATEYEIEGVITQEVFNRNKTLLAKKANFTVYVKNCSWLIQVVELDRTNSIPLRKYEVGSTNGAEIFEVATPLRARSPKSAGLTNSGGTAPRNSGDTNQLRRMTATVVSNTLPVGFLDDAVIGHLWLMFASHCYFEHLKTNQLTPVYDYAASVLRDPNLRLEAQWELMAGPGSVPSKVIFFNRNGLTNAIYAAVGKAETAGIAVPGSFVFEQYVAGGGRGYDLIVRKRAGAVVTAIRSVCTRKNLLPDPDGDMRVNDLRLIRAEPPVKIFAYVNPPRQGWRSAVEARKIYEGKASSRQKRSPSFSPTLLVLFGLAILAPICIAALRTRQYKSRAKR